MSLLLSLLACNPDPGYPASDVGYRPGLEDGPQSGERGSVKITEVLWSGSVDDDGNFDPKDVFVELRNESTVQVDLSGWLIFETGAIQRAFQIPTTDKRLDVGEHVFIAAKDSGCFPDPDWVIPKLEFARGGDGFELTLRDFDERLIEPIGDDAMPAFAGGYDGKRSRSMERVELMFGGEGSAPNGWHFYTDARVEVPNNDRIAENCRRSTKASPGRANSPDYSGAFASGSLE